MLIHVPFLFIQSYLLFVGIEIAKERESVVILIEIG